jgi:predicted nucleic acid-binding protein
VRLYLDSSALVKRYVEEAGSLDVRAAMSAADTCSACWVGFVETFRAVGLTAGERGVRRLRAEWPAFEVIDVGRVVAEEAGQIGWSTGLRSMDAVHLAVALSLPLKEVTFATWDARLHRAARELGLRTLPAALS